MIETFFQTQGAPDASEVPIGCIFVHDGIIVTKARNRTNECMRIYCTCSNTIIETASFIGHSTRGARDRLTLTKLWSRCCHSTCYHAWVCPVAIEHQRSLTGTPTTDLEDVRASGDERVRYHMHHPELGSFCHRIYHPAYPVTSPLMDIRGGHHNSSLVQYNSEHE